MIERPRGGMTMVFGQRDFLTRCPVCKASPGTDLAAEIDTRGIAQCRTCGRQITKQVLYAHWNAEEARYVAQREPSKATARAEKRWWQFWR
jgi:hypothetical protein